MDIKLSGKNKNNQNVTITIPLLPEEISYSSTARFQEYEILDLGEVKLPRGRNLNTYSWDAAFPSINRENLSFLHGGKLQKPEVYINHIEYWKNNQKKVNLMIQSTAFNQRTVYIEEFSYRMTSIGDYQYSISLVDAVDLILNKQKKRASSKNTKKYKVKSNKETLRDIAKKFYGDGGKYNRIYNANKSLIDKKNKAEKKKGRKVSKYKIYKGQVLTIPSASKTTSKKNSSILALQKAINKDKYAKVSETGILDSKTKVAMKKVLIKNGKRGEVVKFVQGKVGVTKDGICGSKTVKGIKSYQRKHGLKVDGIAGYNTLMKMMK